jgi:hypothetical protein
MTDFPRVTGVARDPDNDLVISVCFTQPLTDDQLRAVHEALRYGQAITDDDGELAFA